MQNIEIFPVAYTFIMKCSYVLNLLYLTTMLSKIIPHD